VRERGRDGKVSEAKGKKVLKKFKFYCVK